MKRQFTLRITVEESEKLEAIKKLVGENTDTGAIRSLINNYEELNKRYKAEIEKNGRLDRDKRELKEKISSFLSALNALNV